MIKRICIGVLIMCSIQLVSAQQTFEKTYGTTAAESAQSVRQTADGGYILGGTKLVKVNSQGVEEWSKPLPSVFANVTSDNGYILIRNSSGIIFTKVDSIGNTLWQTVYTEGHWSNEGYYIEQTKDGGYIVSGRYQSVTGSGLLLLKLNAQGGKVWRRTYTESTSAGFNYGFSVQETLDDGYILTGYANIDYYDSTRHRDIFIIKTDNIGTEKWRKFFGGTEDDEGAVVKEDSNGNYFIAGTTNSYGIGTESNMYLIKLDSTGTTLWEKTYGGNLEETATGLWVTTDGGSILTGRSNSFSAGDFDGYIVKTDANGDTLWTNTYGGVGEEALHSVEQTTDGGYIMAGRTSSIGAGDLDMLLLKTDATGSLSFITNTHQTTLPTIEYSIFPNPSQGVFTIQATAQITSIAVFDAIGQRIYFENMNTNQTTFDLSHHGKGVYFYQIRMDGNEGVLTGKVILE